MPYLHFGLGLLEILYNRADATLTDIYGWVCQGIVVKAQLLSCMPIHLFEALPRNRLDLVSAKIQRITHEEEVVWELHQDVAREVDAGEAVGGLAFDDNSGESCYLVVAGVQTGQLGKQKELCWQKGHIVVRHIDLSKLSEQADVYTQLFHVVSGTM